MELVLAGDIAGVFRIMTNELSTPKILFCPADKFHTIATSWGAPLTASNISYFMGLDAEEQYPQMLLCGDANLAVNGKSVGSGILNLTTDAIVAWTKEPQNGNGNIAHVDGSASQTTPSSLQSALVNSGLATNRLLIP